MSQECESLIRRMLVVDPGKRLTIAQIKQHRWVQMGNYQPPLYSAVSFTQPCLQVIGIMKSLGIDQERTLQALQEDSYNHYTAIYYLLLEKLQEPRLGMVTPQYSVSSRPASSKKVSSPGLSFLPCLWRLHPELADPDVELSLPLQSLLYLKETPYIGGPETVQPSHCKLQNPPLSDELPLYKEILGVENEGHKKPRILIASGSSPAACHSLECCLCPPGIQTPPGSRDQCSVPPLSAQSAAPVIQASGVTAASALLPVTFQEGRRASDTSLTQGIGTLRQFRSLSVFVVFWVSIRSNL
ncbi:putative serine/threonine-protein kinase SIK1B [Rhinophrynus dorsalis]